MDDILRVRWKDNLIIEIKAFILTFICHLVIECFLYPKSYITQIYSYKEDAFCLSTSQSSENYMMDDTNCFSNRK